MTTCPNPAEERICPDPRPSTSTRTVELRCEYPDGALCVAPEVVEEQAPWIARDQPDSLPVTGGDLLGFSVLGAMLVAGGLAMRLRRS